MILCLETATPVCSVALCDSTGLVLTRESNENKSHASLLTVFIRELLEKAREENWLLIFEHEPKTGMEYYNNLVR